MHALTGVYAMLSFMLPGFEVIPMVVHIKASPHDPLFLEPRRVVISGQFRPMPGTCKIALTAQVVFPGVTSFRNRPAKMPGKMPGLAMHAPASCSGILRGIRFGRKT